MNPLVIIPTYNERDNVGPMAEKLMALRPEVDALFVDDASPDGTGRILDELAKNHPRLHVLHRRGKEGIGSAHIAGLTWAAAQGRTHVVTMDCDFTHSPEDIPRLLKETEHADAVIGSRYMRAGSLDGWNWKRKFLTNLAHFLTRTLLGLPYDCTGAFRAYRLDRLPPGIFSLVRSMTYPFFFESLHVLHVNGVNITEIPIALPPRTYGNSKMPATEPFRGISRLLEIALLKKFSPEIFRISSRTVHPDPSLQDEQGWDAYWEQAESGGSGLYRVIAAIYRRTIITRRLTEVLRKVFPTGSHVLHAGCGSGQVDIEAQHFLRITAVDTSCKALNIYARTIPNAECIRHASIFALPFPDGSFDGVYNLGVMEHFTEKEISAILGEFRRVLKPGGRLMFFWPHARATSVAVLGFWHKIRKNVLGTTERLHPPEVSLLPSREWAEEILIRSGFQMDSYEFDGRDFWVQAVIVASPLRSEVHNPASPSP